MQHTDHQHQNCNNPRPEFRDMECPRCGCPTDAGTSTDRQGRSFNWRSCNCCAECFWSHKWQVGTPEPEPEED